MIARKRLSLLLAALLLAGMLTAALPVSAHADGSLAIVQGTDPVTRGNKVWFGVLTDSDDYYDEFRNQPVVWRVLDPGNTKSLPVTGSGKALLVSDGILSSSQMQFGSSSNVWADSQVKSWCGTLYSDFGAEKYAVSATSVTEDDSYYYRGGYYDEEFVGASLNAEKFFALSAEEACTYFENDDDRVASGWSHEWWLRSPIANDNDLVGFVDIDGWVSATGYANGSPGVRPAFNLNLSSVLFSSAAAGGKSGDGALSAVSSYSGTEWKLTLKDDGTVTGLNGHTGFAASAVSRSGDVWTIEYSGAKTYSAAAPEYISAVVTDADGAVTQYGRLAQSEGRGTVTVDVSGKLNGGTLYVFNEQYNGDKKTDFASALQKITEPEPAPATVTYTVTKGSGQTWTKGSGKAAAFTVKRSPDDSQAYGLFEKLICDGADVPSSEYKTSSGSLKLSLQASYLETLKEGKHTLRFQFEDGYADARLTVKAIKEVPKTGDASGTGVWAALGLAALGVMLITVRAAKREKRNRTR